MIEITLWLDGKNSYIVQMQKKKKKEKVPLSDKTIYCM